MTRLFTRVITRGHECGHACDYLSGHAIKYYMA